MTCGKELPFKELCSKVLCVTELFVKGLCVRQSSVMKEVCETKLGSGVCVKEVCVREL